MKKLVYPLIFLFGFIIIAQENNNEVIKKWSRSLTEFDSRPKNVVGSSYIDENFLPAKLSNSDIAYALRFNTYQDEMELEQNGKPFVLAKTFDYTITFSGSKKVYKVYNFEFKGRMEKGFFIQVVDGKKFTLLLKEIIKLIPEVHPKSGYDKYKPPTLKRSKDIFFISYKGNTAIEVPGKKKEILELFSDKSKAVEMYAKENKLSFNDTEELIRIFEYYDSL